MRYAPKKGPNGGSLTLLFGSVRVKEHVVQSLLASIEPQPKGYLFGTLRKSVVHHCYSISCVQVAVDLAWH